MDGKRKNKGWDPPVVIFVFSFIQIVIFILIWAFFLWELAREVPLVSSGSKALAKGAALLP